MNNWLTKPEQKYYKEAIKYKYINSGATSLIFRKNKTMIYGITVDYNKIRWLSANKKKFKFKLLKTEQLIGSNKCKVYHYEMVKMEKLTRAHSKYLQMFMDVAWVLYSIHTKVYVSYVKHLLHFTRDEGLTKQLKKVHKVFKGEKVELDLKTSQFRLLNGQIELLDPVYRSNR